MTIFPIKLLFFLVKLRKLIKFQNFHKFFISRICRNINAYVSIYISKLQETLTIAPNPRARAFMYFRRIPQDRQNVPRSVRKKILKAHTLLRTEVQFRRINKTTELKQKITQPTHASQHFSLISHHPALWSQRIFKPARKKKKKKR